MKNHGMHDYNELFQIINAQLERVNELIASRVNNNSIDYYTILQPVWG